MTPEGTGTDKLEQALSSGQLWRAKEILAGRIGSNSFDPKLAEQYGRLLLRMGDDLQAGRYLFLSGERPPEYERPIQLFLRRYSRAGWQSLVSSFPAAARRSDWSKLPERVRAELRAAGVPERPDNEALWTTVRKYPSTSPAWTGCALSLAIIVALAVLLSLVIVYFYRG